MNFCIFKGKVIFDVEFNFIYNKKKISVAKTRLQLQNGSCIIIKGFDAMADWLYRNIEVDDIVIVSGKINCKLETEIEFVRILKTKNLKLT